MVNKIVVGVLAVMVASIVLIASLPIYGGLSETSVSVENEGAGELRFNLADNHTEYNISVTWGDDNIIVANGTDTQAISYDNPTILYADENLAVWYDGNDGYILAPEGDGYATGTVADDMTIVKNSSGLSVTIGDNSPVSYSAPAWAYIANSAGKYGYFEDGTEIKTPANNRLAVVGSFAGVYCYNQYNNYDLPISLELTQEDNVLSGAKWVKALQEPDTSLEPFDPSDITITPLDPGDISITPLDPEPDVSIMSVPTPTYTEGDWGYDLITSGDNTGKAKIVSYSGSGGNLTIPDTVGGYTVAELGKGTNNSTIFDNNSISDTTIIIPSTVKKINQYAFYYISKLKGDLVIPSNVEQIGFSAFSYTGITSLNLTDGLKRIDSNVFDGCSNLIIDDLTIPDTVTTLGGASFSNCGGVNNIILPTGISTIDSKLFQQTPVTGDIIIPSGVTSISNMAFQQCGNNVGVIIIPDSVNSISQEAFGVTQYVGIVTMVNSGANINNYAFYSGGRTFGEVLNLGSLELTATSYGLKSNEVRSDIPALGYISTVEYTESAQAEGAVYDLLNLVPLLSVFGLVLGAIAVFLIRRA